MRAWSSRGPAAAARSRVGAPTKRDTIPTTAASTRFITPAACVVPGSPIAGINTNVLASTPNTAPMLLVKYSIDSDRPGSNGNARRMPALISGNVVPSRIDCGRISRPARIHCGMQTPSAEHSAGISDAYAQSVAWVKMNWNEIAKSPTMASMMA